MKNIKIYTSNQIPKDFVQVIFVPEHTSDDKFKNIKEGRYYFFDNTLFIGRSIKESNKSSLLSSIQEPGLYFNKSFFKALEQGCKTHEISKLCLSIQKEQISLFLKSLDRYFSYFDKYKTKKVIHFISEICFLTDDKQVEYYVNEHIILRQSINLSNLLINEPANVCTTDYMVDNASKLAKENNKCNFTLLNSTHLEDLGMGCFKAVAQGSDQEPYLAILEYKNSDTDPIVIVGKGLVYDTGGLDIKTNNAMRFMHADMSGCAVILGILKAIMTMDIKINLVVALGLAENATGPNSYRPSDILKSHHGTYVEVVDTDAEGRLVLCDVLSYMFEQYKPKFMINLATLTGLSSYFLGCESSGFFCNDQELANDFIESAVNTNTSIWQFPLFGHLKSDLSSQVADITNVSSKRGKGPIHAAIFLQHFVSCKWAHFDIAGLDDSGLAISDNLIYMFVDFLKNKLS